MTRNRLSSQADIRLHRVIGWLAVLIVAALAGPVTASAASTKFDAVAQFSLTKNPNGVWSYRENGNLFSQTINNDGGGPLTCWWNAQQVPTSENVCANQTSQTVSFQTIVIPPGWIDLGVESAKDAVQWTAPSAGTYAVKGSFMSIDTYVAINDASHPVAITHNGATVYSNTVAAYDQPDPFNLSIHVNAGDKVSFLVEPSPSTWTNLSTGLQATITGGPPASVRCVVPRLNGLTLSKATSSLKSAHCGLGTVTKKGRARKVVSQKPTAGTRLANGSKVSITLR